MNILNGIVDIVKNGNNIESNCEIISKGNKNNINIKKLNIYNLFNFTV